MLLFVISHPNSSRRMPKNRAYFDDDDLDDEDYDDYIDKSKLKSKNSKPNQQALTGKIKSNVVVATKKIDVAKKPSISLTKMQANESGNIKDSIGKEVAENLAKNVSSVSIKDATDISVDKTDISDSKNISNGNKYNSNLYHN